MALAIGKIRKNISLIRQQILVLLKNTSNTVKCIWLIVLISYSLSFFEEAIDILSVTPGSLFPPSFRIWTAFTFCFLETHFWNVFIDILMVGVCGKVIEPLWGPTEIISFFVIVNIGVALLGSTFFFFVYMCSSNPDILFNVHIHGLSGYIAGVTVAIKQIMPDILVVKTPLGRITNKNVPLLCILVSLVLWLLNLSPSSTVIMIIFGVYVSWIYLRFYQKHPSGTKGDMSESFSFASLFPSIIQPTISVFSNSMYNLLIKMKVCKKRAIPSAADTELSSVTIGSSSFTSQDIERRKKKAMKALTEHLNKADRPRVVGTVIPQKIKIQSPQKKIDIVASPNSAFEPTEKDVLLPNEVTEHSVSDV